MLSRVLAELRSTTRQHSPLHAAPTPYSPEGIRLLEKPGLTRWPLYQDGKIEVQDEGSQLIAHLVAPRRGEMVVDFCAGAGGKTLALGSLMRSTGRIYAFDIHARRLAGLGPRLKRSGLSNVHPAAIASENDLRVKRLSGKIDRVLVDAPCSGSGTLRRNPDLKWRFDEKEPIAKYKMPGWLGWLETLAYVAAAVFFAYLTYKYGMAIFAQWADQTLLTQLMIVVVIALGVVNIGLLAWVAYFVIRKMMGSAEMPLVTLSGLLFFGFLDWLLIEWFFDPGYLYGIGWQNSTSMLFMIIMYALAAVIFLGFSSYRKRQGIDVDKVYKEIPVE